MRSPPLGMSLGGYPEQGQYQGLGFNVKVLGTVSSSGHKARYRQQSKLAIAALRIKSQTCLLKAHGVLY